MCVSPSWEANGYIEWYAGLSRHAGLVAAYLGRPTYHTWPLQGRVTSIRFYNRCKGCLQLVCLNKEIAGSAFTHIDKQSCLLSPSPLQFPSVLNLFPHKTKVIIWGDWSKHWGVWILVINFSSEKDIAGPETSEPRLKMMDESYLLQTKEEEFWAHYLLTRRNQRNKNKIRLFPGRRKI